jgi:hypothetical protein
MLSIFSPKSNCRGTAAQYEAFVLVLCSERNGTSNFQDMDLIPRIWIFCVAKDRISVACKHINAYSNVHSLVHIDISVSVDFNTYLHSCPFASHLFRMFSGLIRSYFPDSSTRQQASLNFCISENHFSGPVFTKLCEGHCAVWPS